MGFNKQDILNALSRVLLPGTQKTLIAAESIKNVQVFGNEVVIDISTSNPAMQARKKIEADIEKALTNTFGVALNVQTRIKVTAPKAPISIKGAPIPGIKNIIAIASGKGGVGKSTVAANLAVTLSEMGFKTGLLDADIYGPSIPLMFDVVNERPLAVDVNGKSKMKPIESYGVRILSIGFFTQPAQAVIWRGPMAAKALNQLIFDAHWDSLDFLLLDLPPGTGDIHLSIMQALPITGAVIVSTPQAVALADARKAVSMFQQEAIQVPVLGIVENMAWFTPAELPDNKYFLFGKEGALHLASDLQLPLLGQIPIVQSIREAGDYGRPAALQQNTALKHIFENTTREMVREVVSRNKNLPPTEAIKITTMAGCEAVKKV